MTRQAFLARLLPSSLSDSSRLISDPVRRLICSSTLQRQDNQSEKSGGESAESMRKDEEVEEEVGEEEQDDGIDVKEETGEVGGPSGPEPTRYGDWERKGRCSDF